MISAQAELQTAQQNLGARHPEVVSLAEKVRLTRQFLESAQQRINQRMAQLSKTELGP